MKFLFCIALLGWVPVAAVAMAPIPQDQEYRVDYRTGLHAIPVVLNASPAGGVAWDVLYENPAIGGGGGFAPSFLAATIGLRTPEPHLGASQPAYPAVGAPQPASMALWPSTSPELYALLLTGVGAMGTIARRRSLRFRG